MDLVHELCPLQLKEVTKKSDNLSGWLASIQHLAHIYSGKVKWTDKEYGKEFTTLDMWVLNPQWRSKDTCHKCTRSPAIHHLVISARLDTAGPGWTRAKPANQSLDHVASVQTLKATKLCAMYCTVLSQRCTVQVPGQTGFLSSVAMSLYVASVVGASLCIYLSCLTVCLHWIEITESMDGGQSIACKYFKCQMQIQHECILVLVQLEVKAGCKTSVIFRIHLTQENLLLYESSSKLKLRNEEDYSCFA